MSARHPIIAVTGSSGAGTSTVTRTFAQIFRREGIVAGIVEGDAFHRFNRGEMDQAMADAVSKGNQSFSHFGPDANLLHELESLFRQYGENGTGMVRRYLHSEELATEFRQLAGAFTEWAPLDEGTDLLFYEGLHGAVVTDKVDVARHPDLLVGVVPIINLEWMQKLHRDRQLRGYSTEAVVDTVLRRMPDYVNYITPQFARTHINFQRVPTVDTSNPFIARAIPTLDESMVVIRFRNPKDADFPFLLNMIHDSFMSRPNTIVVPGGKMGMAIELILTPLILNIVAKSRA